MGWLAPVAAAAVLVAGCFGSDHVERAVRRPTFTPPTSAPPSTPAATHHQEPPRATTVTLGFAGDVHFENQLAQRLQHPRHALGPIAAALRRPDLMMVNLETPITDRGIPQPKEYHFRTSPRALEALDAAGVDVVTIANNHAVDYGAVGLQDTLAAVRRSPIPVVGIGRNLRDAFRPYVATVRGVQIAVIAATTLPDITATQWAAGRHRPGVAVALLPRPRLVRAVRAAKQQADVVVVYLHWGEENEACPYWRPRRHARVLAAAGADVVIGSHAHVLLGSGWQGETYVDYGLGNFVWYAQTSIDTGVLSLEVRDGQVVSDSFAPADIGADGLPRLVSGAAKAGAVADWRALRGCTGLAGQPPR